MLVIEEKAYEELSDDGAKSSVMTLEADIHMTKQEKKEHLRQYRAAEREEERLSQEIERWRSRSEKTTVECGRAFGRGDGRSLEHTVGEIDDLSRQLVSQREKLVSLRRQIGIAIDAVPDERLQELLKLRYIEGMTWEKISERMNYSYMQVNRLHEKALSELRM